LDYEQIATPFPDTRVDNISSESGVVDSLARLTTALPEGEIIRNLRSRIKDSIGYWDDMQGYNLRYARAQSERMVLGKQIDISKLYRYSIPYIENEIHVGVDTIMAYVTASTPKVEVWPSQDTEQSRLLARDLNKGINSHSERHNLAKIFELAVHDNLVKRVGVIKLHYDPDIGPEGEIVPSVMNPDWIVVDKNSLMNANPDFIAEAHKESIEKIVERYPKKKKEILTALSIKRGTKSQLSAEVVWWEVHATTYKNYGDEPIEMVFEFVEDVMLAQYKDPNWIYEGDNGRLTNFLDKPRKPYIPLNYLNDGTHWIDQTTPVEQAYSMQDVLNKRGSQIMQNADTANGFLAFSSEGITADDVENLVGDPNQKFIIATNGRPLSDYVMQIPPHMLPDYVVEDKMDLRTSIKTLMASPAQLEGSNQTSASGDQTATEAMMIKNQASGRLDRLIRAVEFTAGEYFNFLVQMMRVHYTEKHWFVHNGGDGEFDYVALDRNVIEKGMMVNISSGSTLPYDKARSQSVAMNLAKMGLISPLDLFKDLDLDNPQQRYENWVKWKTDPMSLSKDALMKGQDSKALAEYVAIMGGAKDVKPYDDADEDHLATHRKQMITSEFLKSTRIKQMKLLKIVEQEINSFELRQALDAVGKTPEQIEAESQPPQSPPQPQQPMMGQPPMPGQMPPGMPGQPPMGGMPPMQPPMPGGGPGTPMAPMGQGMASMPPMASPAMGAPAPSPIDQLINQVLQQVNPAERMELGQVLNPDTQPIVDMTDPNNLNLV